MDKIKINLFGESWSLKELELDETLQSKLLFRANQLNRDLSDLLLDLSFYEELNLPNLKSITDLPSTCIKGLRNTPKSQLEIWLNGKKILKIRLEPIFNQNTLFQLYHTHETIVDFKDLDQGIYVFEQEMGLIASYQFNTLKFCIDQLSFGLLKFKVIGQKIELLTDIFWCDKLLNSIYSDSLITSSSITKK